MSGGAVNAVTFVAFVEQVLARERMRRLSRAAFSAAVLAGPEPGEMIFSKIKQALRSLACSTVEMLWASILRVPDIVAEIDAAMCFKHRGYSLRME